MPLLDKLRRLNAHRAKLDELRHALRDEIEAAGVKWQEVALIDKPFAICLRVNEIRAMVESGDRSLNYEIALNGLLRTATNDVEQWIQDRS